MDGTFIDDRKIHVGFNQSSFKIWRQVWRKDSQHGKGREIMLPKVPRRESFVVMAVRRFIGEVLMVMVKAENDTEMNVILKTRQASTMVEDKSSENWRGFSMIS
uniref:Uncharacterized protein n=2 Tax=Arabidopsis thaliana TaxID=3702 RepID=Q1PFN3_ARATH|nr:hypothetical protein At1g44478 [Arabidopsis thaliana]